MATRRLSRRAFLRLAALGGIAAGGAVIERTARPVGLLNYLRWTLRGAEQATLGRPMPVGLGECTSYGGEVLDCLRELWRQARMPLVQGKRVLVKPNLIDLLDGHPVTTDPAVVAAILDLLVELGAAEIAVGDGPGFRREAEPVARSCGLAAVLAARHVPFVDLNYDDPRPVPARDGWFRGASAIWLPRHVREADFVISVPKMKTHHWAGVSLSLKNLFGILPGARYGWPKNMLHVNGLPLSILGLYALVRPRVLGVVDGIVGMEGDGPLFGTPVPHGVMAVSADPVALDLTCAQLMGFSSKEVDHLQLAEWAGLGKPGYLSILDAEFAHLQLADTRRGGETLSVEVQKTVIERLKRQYKRPPVL